MFYKKKIKTSRLSIADCFRILTAFSIRIYQRNDSEKIFKKSVALLWPFDFRCYDHIYKVLDSQTGRIAGWPRPANRLVLLTWTPRVRACGRALIGRSLLAYIHKTSSIPLGHRLHITAQSVLHIVSGFSLSCARESGHSSL